MENADCCHGSQAFFRFFSRDLSCMLLLITEVQTPCVCVCVFVPPQIHEKQIAFFFSPIFEKTFGFDDDVFLFGDCCSQRMFQTTVDMTAWYKLNEEANERRFGRLFRLELVGTERHCRSLAAKPAFLKTLADSCILDYRLEL